MIAQAGVGALPVLAFGNLAIGLAIAQLWRPRRALGPLIYGMCLASVLSGLLATTVGIQISIEAVAQMEDPRWWIVLIGAKEALFNTVFALGLAAVTAILHGFGQYRAAHADNEPEATSVARP